MSGKYMENRPGAMAAGRASGSILGMKTALALAFAVAGPLASAEPGTPRIDGAWWRIAAPPQLERWAKPGVQAVDFTIFQAADGTWQLFSCIRGTAAPGKGRLLYRWQAKHLEDADWAPCGIFREADPALGQQEGLLQAPYCLRDGSRWLLFCNSAGARCLESKDGIAFSWAENAAGESKFFDMGRDLMILDQRDVDGRWYALYTDIVPGKYPERQNHTVSFRSAATLDGVWSAKTDIGVLTPSFAGDGYPFCEAESPFVVHRGGWYYRWEQMDVFASRSLSDWTGARRTELVPGPGGRRSFLAPEIVEHDGASYIGAYSYDHGRSGIYLARLAWGR
jgi:hypothetical protein